MKHNFKYTLILILTASIFALAQPVKLNSVNDAIEYAFENNPDLEVYNKNQTKARYDYNSVKNYRWPVISGSFSGVDNIKQPVTLIPGEIFGQPGSTIEAQFGEKYNYNAGINISKNILDFQSKFTASVAEVNVEIAKTNKNAYKQKLAEQVSLYYYTALITTKALETQKADYETANDVLKIVEQKFDQGIVDQITVNLAEMNTNSIYQNIGSYKTILEQCRANLKILFGLDLETEIIFQEKFKTNNITIPSYDFISPDKSLEVLRLQLKQADYKISQQRASWLPKISISRYIGAQHYRDNFGISFEKNDWSKIQTLTLNISVPIFNGFSTKNKVDAAKIEYEIQRNTFESELMSSKIEDDLILKEFNNSKETVKSANDNYQIAKENTELQYQKFEQGVVGLDKYLDSFDDYLKAEATYLNLLSDSYNYYSKILSRNF
jgi:outer membrane protein